MLINITSHILNWDCITAAIKPTSFDMEFESIIYGFSSYGGVVAISKELQNMIGNSGIIRLHNTGNKGYSSPLVVTELSETGAKKIMGTNPIFSLEVNDVSLATRVKLIS